MKADLSLWLDRISALNCRSICLGLGRLREVYARFPQGQPGVVLVVAGTNGKGSICAILNEILLSAGYRVGCYTSPHLMLFNERISVMGQPVSDAQLVAAFEQVDAYRGDVALTFFEYTTLAAWWLFKESQLDATILEVGMGGRYDAVNLFQKDAVVVSNIGLDHQHYLGQSREQIALEKVGVACTGVPLVCADRRVPQNILSYCEQHSIALQLIGRDFDVQQSSALLAAGHWQYRVGRRGHALAYPKLKGHHQLDNAAAALTVLECVQDQLPVTWHEKRRGLARAHLPGRFQMISAQPMVVVDVAHNPDSAQQLGHNLRCMPFYPETYAIFGVFKDKDVWAILSCLKDRVDHWYFCALESLRSEKVENLVQIAQELGISSRQVSLSPVEAYHRVRTCCQKQDRIVVCGSFLCVAPILALHQQEQGDVVSNVKDG